ncbi:MAG: GAF domain-containing protein [Actinomycetota bacterium]|nr:GAF domain-containing protein [Actinomycetota bacterium]
MSEEPQRNDELEQARATLARQAAEIERLRREIAEDEAADFRELLTILTAAGAIVSPVSHARLLELIVETAANVIDAKAAALFLLDESTDELVFEVALGEKADEAERFRVPVGHGIAGLVAQTGQPIAVSDAQHDPRHAVEIAQRIGYLPNSVLCVPLHYRDRVVGVLELLDKRGAASFSGPDIEALGLFARQAAVAIEQSQAHRTLAGLLKEFVAPAEPADPEHRMLEKRIDAFLASLDVTGRQRRAVTLAGLVGVIAARGEDEMEACERLLRGFSDYLHARERGREQLGTLE